MKPSQPPYKGNGIHQHWKVDNIPPNLSVSLTTFMIRSDRIFFLDFNTLVLCQSFWQAKGPGGKRFFFPLCSMVGSIPARAYCLLFYSAKDRTPHLWFQCRPKVVSKGSQHAKCFFFFFFFFFLALRQHPTAKTLLCSPCVEFPESRVLFWSALVWLCDCPPLLFCFFFFFFFSFLWVFFFFFFFMDGGFFFFFVPGLLGIIHQWEGVWPAWGGTYEWVWMGGW